MEHEIKHFLGGFTKREQHVSEAKVFFFHGVFFWYFCNATFLCGHVCTQACCLNSIVRCWPVFPFLRKRTGFFSKESIRVVDNLLFSSTLGWLQGSLPREDLVFLKTRFACVCFGINLNSMGHCSFDHINKWGNFEYFYSGHSKQREWFHSRCGNLPENLSAAFPLHVDWYVTGIFCQIFGGFAFSSDAAGFPSSFWIMHSISNNCPATQMLNK